MRFRVGLVAFVMVAASCGGSSSSSGGAADSAGEGAADVSSAVSSSDSADQAEGSDASTTDETCLLLSVDEVEGAVGRTVIDVGPDGESGDVYGNCLWYFEPLTEGLFEGESPYLLVQAFESTEYYDQFLEGYPDAGIDGIGDGALSRGVGEVIISANGDSLIIGTMMAFDAEDGEQAQHAVNDLGRLIAARL